MRIRLNMRLAAAVLCLAALNLPVHADNLTGAISTISQTWLGTEAHPIRLYNSESPDALFVPFTNTLSGSVSVTFSAECQLIAPRTSFLSLTILIDGIPVAPTGLNLAFCSGRGAGAVGGWSSNSFTVSRPFAAGTEHRVTVIAQVVGEHTGARIDDTMVLIAR